jgi:hypothetical protein
MEEYLEYMKQDKIHNPNIINYFTQICKNKINNTKKIMLIYNVDISLFSVHKFTNLISNTNIYKCPETNKYWYETYYEYYNGILCFAECHAVNEFIKLCPNINPRDLTYNKKLSILVFKGNDITLNNCDKSNNAFIQKKIYNDKENSQYLFIENRDYTCKWEKI